MPKSKKALIIGGGLGGLSSAISLRSKGYEVALFEKNPHFGGKLNHLEKEGFKFDLGPSILTMPHIFEKLFKEAGKSISDSLEFISLDPQWRNFFEGSKKTFDLWGDRKRREEALRSFAGEESVDECENYLKYCEGQLDIVTESYFSETGIDDFWSLIGHFGIFKSTFKVGWMQSLSGSIESYITDPKLRMVFEYFIKYVGSSALRAPALLGLLFSMQIRYGLWYVKGGMFEISKALVKLAKELGVELHSDADVKLIQKEGKKVKGLKLVDGRTFSGDLIICNQEIVPASRGLLDLKENKVNKLEKRFAPSCSGLVIHLGTRKQYPQLAHHNFFYSKDQTEHFDKVFKRSELPSDPTLYVVAPSRSDASVCPEGHDNIKILPHIPPLIEGYEPTDKDYEALRTRVLEKMERMGLKGLSDSICVEETWDPRDIQKAYRSNRGSIYGVVSDRFKNQGIKAPKQSPDFSNLFFVGGSVNPGPGMPMVVLGGMQTAALAHSLH